jgi:hypothetical protein
MKDNNTITITLDDLLGPDGLEGAWEAMVRGLVASAESKFVHADTNRNFHKTVVEAIDTAVTKVIANKIEAKMNEPIQMTDRFGRPQGDTTSFEEMIQKAVEDAFSVKVDVYGQPRGNGDRTLLSRALRTVAFEGLDKAVREAVSKVREDAKAAVAKHVAASVAKQLK